MLECVINISEGRQADIIEAIGDAAGRHLLDTHSDPDHHRSVFTVVGSSAARDITGAALVRIDLRDHEGVHPRIGVVDVVPFVALGDASIDDAITARDAFADWAGSELGVPCFVYGPERSLPSVRRDAWLTLEPDTGPPSPHPTGGAIAVGARPPLVAYNLWLEDADLGRARGIARDLRRPGVRALGLQVGTHAQVSMNLIDPLVVGPDDVYDLVAGQVPVSRAELVGLIPGAALRRIDPSRWAQLDLDDERTIEARIAARGLSIG
jgi:glutamate formiminotransferase / 5-formyltetrahydrofolate cyclo-ligase